MINNSLFKYCPHCGSQQIADQSDSSMLCKSCGYIFYQNTAAATAAILIYQGHIIFTKRGRDPGKGMLDLPGGFVDYNESAEHGLLREIAEETGFIVKNLTYFSSGSNQYLYKNVLYHTCDLVFTGEINDISTFKPSEEIPEIVLLKPEFVNLEEIAFESLQKMVHQYIKNYKTEFDNA